MRGHPGQVHRRPPCPASVGDPQALLGRVDRPGRPNQADRTHQRPAKPRRQPQVMQAPGYGFLPCHPNPPLHAGGRRDRPAERPPRTLALIVEVDLLLADFLGHLALVGDRLGVQAHPLPRHPSPFGHRLLLAQHHLVLGLGMPTRSPSRCMINA